MKRQSAIHLLAIYACVPRMTTQSFEKTTTAKKKKKLAKSKITYEFGPQQQPKITNAVGQTESCLQILK